MNETEKFVVELVSKVCRTTEENVMANRTSVDLWDSFGLVEIALGLEEKFDIFLEPEQIESFKAVEDILGHLNDTVEQIK